MPSRVLGRAQPLEHLLAPLVRAQQPVALVGDAHVGLGLGRVPEHPRLAQHRDNRLELALEPRVRDRPAVQELHAVLEHPKAPRLDALGQPRVVVGVAQVDALARLGRQRDALGEQALVVLGGQVGQTQRAVGADLRDDLGDERVEVAQAERAGDRDAVVAVPDEVHLADAVHGDRRQRVAAAHGGGDALPARAHPRRGRPELAVEAAAAVDGADDRVERDRVQAEVALAHASQRGDDLVEGEDHVDVPALAGQEAGEPGDGLPAARAQEVVLGVDGVEAGAQRGHDPHRLPYGRIARPPCAEVSKAMLRRVRAGTYACTRRHTDVTRRRRTRMAPSEHHLLDPAEGATLSVHGLKANAIGYVSNVVIGVASTAPAYSLAATLGFVVAVAGVGVHAPAVLLVSLVPILFVAAGYKYLNKAEPDAGTSFAWVTRAMGPQLGWLAGWAIVAADIIVMATL